MNPDTEASQDRISDGNVRALILPGYHKHVVVWLRG